MAYNEAASVEATAREIHEALERFGPGHELLIVDDGSTDGTEGIADRLVAQLNGVRTIHHRPNRGLGGVYRTGFAEARGDLLSFFPADGQFPASILESFVPLMRDRDLVLGYIPDRPGPFSARLFSRFERALYVLLFGGFPRFQGVLMVRRRLLREMTLISTGRGWTVLMEMILRAVRAGARVSSVPTTLRPRKSGMSKVTDLRTVCSNLRQVLGLRYRF